MPNHVTTRCVVSGPTERIQAFREKHIVVDKDGLNFDFNTFVPMPALVRDTESSSTVEFALFATGKEDVVPRWSGIPMTSPLTYQWAKDKGIATREEFKAWLEKEHPDAFAKAEKCIQAQAETGYSNWYDWSLANWGTKWGAYSFHLVDDKPDRLEFMFDTAWSTPEPIFNKIGELYPDLLFRIHSFDEGWNFGVDAEIRDGKFVIHSNTPTDALYERVYGEAPNHGEEE